MRIVVVNDKTLLEQTLVAKLSEESFAIEFIKPNLSEVLDTLKNNSVAAVLLCVPFENVDASDMVRKIREMNFSGGILCARDGRDPEGTIALYEAGVDDVALTPINTKHLAARIRAVVRRVNGHAKTEVKIGELVFPFDGRPPILDGQMVPLSSRERSLLECLALRSGKLVSRQTIFQSLYGAFGREVEPKIIDVYVCKLRKKLRNSQGQSYIVTVFGTGYMLADPDNS